MKLVEILRLEAVNIEIKANNKEEALTELVDLLASSGSIKNSEKSTILKKLKEKYE